MNKHQTQHEKDKKSYVSFIKKIGHEPQFMGSTRDQKEKYNTLRGKWITKWEKWSNEK